MTRYLIPFFALICTFLTPIHGNAGLVLQFTDATGTPQSTFQVSSIGDSVDVHVFLVETSPSTILFDEGLFSAGFQVDYSAGGGSTVATVSDASKAVYNPNFDLTDQLAGVVIGANNLLFDLATQSLVFGIGETQIPIATIRFTGIQAGLVTLSLSDLDGGDNFLTQQLSALDADIDFSTTATIQVNAVPEPTSVVYSVLAMAFLSKRIYRNRRKPNCST